MLLKKPAVLLIINCIYYVSEHLKYCTQVKEYWFNKNICVNIMSDSRDDWGMPSSIDGETGNNGVITLPYRIQAAAGRYNLT